MWRPRDPVTYLDGQLGPLIFPTGGWYSFQLQQVNQKGNSPWDGVYFKSADPGLQDLLCTRALLYGVALPVGKELGLTQVHRYAREFALVQYHGAGRIFECWLTLDPRFSATDVEEMFSERLRVERLQWEARKENGKVRHVTVRSRSRAHA